MNAVLDSSAALAYLWGESGGEAVDGLLTDPANACLMHALNLCEVYYIVRRDHGERAAQIALAGLREAGVVVCEDFDDGLWQAAGRLKADVRKMPLADCVCAALASREQADVFTADREFGVAVDAGICAVRYIR